MSSQSPVNLFVRNHQFFVENCIKLTFIFYRDAPENNSHRDMYITPSSGHQWRHQDLKSGGARRGQRLIMGGQTCARSAHSEREARADFFELLGSDFFWANMCAERT